MASSPLSGRFATCILTVVLLGANSPLIHAGELSPALSLTLSFARPDERVSAVFSLREQVDTERLSSALSRQSATRASRHLVVVEELQRATERTQPAFLQEVEDWKAAGKVDGFTSYWIANLVVVSGSREAVLSLAEHPSIDRVELNRPAQMIEPIEVFRDEPPLPPGTGSGVPDGIRAIRADKVWKELGVTGSGTIVATIDTGVNAFHDALRSNWRGLDADPSACWFSVLNGSSTTPSDGDGHGTHVTGTMCGLSEYGDSIGVAPGAEWIAANAVSSRVQLTQFSNFILDSFQWLADPDGDPNTMDDVPDVVQNSWGVGPDDGPFTVCGPTWWAAIDNCEAAGVVVTFSAGNSGPTAQSLVSPASRASTPLKNFAVGAIDTHGEQWPYPIAGFSSRGPTICGPEPAIKPEIVAPGFAVYSSWGQANEYRRANGTSMAGPHVAGVVALMREVNPDLSADEVKQILIDTARPYGVEDNTFGHGLVDAYDAVLAAAAANGSGRLVGTIRSGEAPVVGAVVELLGTDRSWRTSSDGQFGGFVPTGEHVVRVTHPLFETRSFPAFEVVPTAPVELEFSVSDRTGPWVHWFHVNDAVSTVGDSIDVVAMLEDYSGVSTVEVITRVGQETWETIPLRWDRPSRWSARLPGKQFGATYELYLRAVDSIGQVTEEPNDGRSGPLEITLRKSVLKNDVETEEDWLLVAEGDTPIGKWKRIDPFATEYFGRPVAPEDDHSADGVHCFVTGKGKRDVEVDRADVDDGCVTLRSPLFDLTGLESAGLEYWRWFANEGRVRAGSFETSISSDGGATWATLESIFASEAEWVLFETELAGRVEFTDGIQVRFVACDLGDDSLIEAAVDDFWIRGSVPKVIAEQTDPSHQPGIVSITPNPFSERTQLVLNLPAEGSAEVLLFDPSGRRVRELLSGAAVAGETILSWDGRDELGQLVPSGVYFYRLRTGSVEDVGRVLRIR